MQRSGAALAVALKAAAAGIGIWFRITFIDLGRQLRWSYLPPLMVYLAAGISSLTAIVGTFFVKDYLGLSAAFLARLPLDDVLDLPRQLEILVCDAFCRMIH